MGTAVLFTSLTLLASSLMFREWRSQTFNAIAAMVLGFGITCCGVGLMHASKAREEGKHSAAAQSAQPTSATKV